MTKQEKIQEQWGVHYASDINENGYRIYKEVETIHLSQWGDEYFEKGFNEVTKKYWVRPKSLQAIENNNGWIKIESVADLPKEDIECYVTNQIGRIQFGEFEKETERFFVNNDRIHPTHYQKVIKPNYPIY